MCKEHEVDLGRDGDIISIDGCTVEGNDRVHEYCGPLLPLSANATRVMIYCIHD